MYACSLVACFPYHLTTWHENSRNKFDVKPVSNINMFKLAHVNGDPSVKFVIPSANKHGSQQMWTIPYPLFDGLKASYMWT